MSGEGKSIGLEVRILLPQLRLGVAVVLLVLAGLSILVQTLKEEEDPLGRAA